MYQVEKAGNKPRLKPSCSKKASAMLKLQEMCRGADGADGADGSTVSAEEQMTRKERSLCRRAAACAAPQYDDTSRRASRQQACINVRKIACLNCMGCTQYKCVHISTLLISRDTSTLQLSRY
jgi:hypothetical protein